MLSLFLNLKSFHEVILAVSLSLHVSQSCTMCRHKKRSLWHKQPECGEHSPAFEIVPFSFSEFARTCVEAICTEWKCKWLSPEPTIFSEQSATVEVFFAVCKNAKCQIISISLRCLNVERRLLPFTLLRETKTLVAIKALHTSQQKHVNLVSN